MKEELLHYVWQHQYYDKANLITDQGEKLTVLRPGQHNTDAGPDFLNARLQIGKVEWNGAVEIHLRASDWQRHQHQTDLKYDQVVLHVVYAADQQVQRTNGTPIPSLTLAPRLTPNLLTTYAALGGNLDTVSVPCAPFLSLVPSITRTMMLGRALMERVEQKAAVLEIQNKHLGGDWEATAYHALAAAFGFKKNSEPLARLAKALPLPILRRHRHNLLQTEALLFGQAGLLPVASNLPPNDIYLANLRREYDFLCHKYELAALALPAHAWNFLRLRPANFPTVRIAQLAALLYARPALFDALLTAASVGALEQFFRVAVSDYWQTHYRPGSPGKVAALGRSSIHLLIINVVVPLRVAYARHVGQPELVEQAVTLLEQLPAEHNHLTAPYEALNFEHSTAADSQGLLAMHHGYCQPRRCLQCAVGSRILQHNLPPR